MSASFQGYIRSDGSVGTRNYVGIVSSVICSSTVVQSIAKQVPNAVPVVHTNGCAQLGDDLVQTRSTLVGVSCNPNISSVLLVGLGCETNQVDELAANIPSIKPLQSIGIQELCGSEKTVKEGIKIAKEWAEETSLKKRQSVSFSSLTVGVIGLETDEKTLATAYPVIGKVVDRILDFGANVVVGLSRKIEPAGLSLSQRASNPEAAKRLSMLADGLSRRRWETTGSGAESRQSWSKDELEQAQFHAEITGTKPIEEVVGYGERSFNKGLRMMAVPENPVEALSGLAAGGCSVVLIVSSRGIFTGSVALPCLVIAPKDSNSSLSEELVDCMVTGQDPETEIKHVMEVLNEVCSGKPTSLEALQLGDFAISRVGTPF